MVLRWFDKQSFISFCFQPAQSSHSAMKRDGVQCVRALRANNLRSCAETLLQWVSLTDKSLYMVCCSRFLQLIRYCIGLILGGFDLPSFDQAIVITHEKSRKEDLSDYLTQKFAPMVPHYIQGRSAKCEPSCDPTEALWYAWKDPNSCECVALQTTGQTLLESQPPHSTSEVLPLCHYGQTWLAFLPLGPVGLQHQ